MRYVVLAGRILFALIFKARLGAWALVVFLVPVTFMMHAFWRLPDPVLAHTQQALFAKNISMLGAALMVAYFGSGPISLDGGH
jgi:putative oxidoreductase